MLGRLLVVVSSVIVCHAVSAREDARGSHPVDAWEFVIESGYLWQVGDSTPLDYEIVPTQFTLRTPVVFSLWEGDQGGRFVVRSRFSLLMESFLVGAETYYAGLAAAPSLEYWFPGERTSIFYSIGGGVGLTDSTGKVGGQGQDFTLNWFAQIGFRQSLTESVSVLGGAYFLHHSNGGQSNPNPGIDALGFSVGLGWSF